MPEPTIVRDEADIVLIGAFNPAIFQPKWFQGHKLIQDTEADAAQIEVIHNEITIFSLKWVRFEITRNSFVARSNDPSHFDPLRDIVVSVFQLLEHTPISKIGLNHNIFFKLQSEDAWHQIGHTLAPKEIWMKYLKNPGLKNLTIEASRNDDFQGYINVTIQPPTRNVVSIAINDHYEIGNGDGRNASDIVTTQWRSSIDYALELAKSIYKDAVKP
ncbi:MAG: hypothetical protein U1F68_01180 [Gammaproteobacteria bacterium]